MLYKRELLLKRLQECEKEILTETELLELATPCIRSIGQVAESVKKAIDKGCSGDYTINYISGITGISRRSFYRWIDYGIIQMKDNMLNICELYRILLLIQKRHVKH